MKISDILSINTKKLKVKTKNSLFLIVPIAILVAISVVVSSQTKNFREASDQSIFGTIEEQSRILTLVKEYEENLFRMMGSGPSTEDVFFSEADLSKVQSIDGVESAQLLNTLPLDNVYTDDLIEDKVLPIRDLVGMDSEIASLITDSDFEYVEGEPIPIILNSRVFVETVEDWGGETSLEIDFRAMREAGEEIQNATPIKTNSISYEKDEIIGSEIAIKMAGLSDLLTYSTERNMGVISMTKLTETELQEQDTERQDLISEYWDYDALNTPIEYTFEIVDVIESENDRYSVIPEAFAEIMVSDFIEHQIEARNSKAIPLDDLGSVYTGMSYDGTELSDGSMNFGPARMIGIQGMGRPGEPSTDSSYRIPGLVYEVDSEGETQGELTDSGVYGEAVKFSESIAILIEDVYVREEVIDGLNDAGYAYQDFSELEIFGSIEETLNAVTVWMTIGFIILTGAVVILTMSKFVSESVKEIGIFRAIGAKKREISLLFVMQAIMYAGLGYVIGLVGGIGLNFGLASSVYGWFDSVVSSTIAESYNVVSTVDSSLFTGVDWVNVGVFTGVLFVITLIVSMIPANRAASVSPVEAIKDE